MTQKTVILVVEDEAIIRMGAVQLFEEAGYTSRSQTEQAEAGVVQTIQQKQGGFIDAAQQQQSQYQQAADSVASGYGQVAQTRG